jgi:hypothetical protein
MHLAHETRHTEFVTLVSGWYAGDSPETYAQVDAAIETPLALGTIALCGYADDKLWKAAKAAGWRPIMWGKTNHTWQSYPVVLVGKRYPANKPTSNTWGAGMRQLGCSDLFDPNWPPRATGWNGAVHLRVYVGPKLSLAKLEEARDKGWKRVRGTEVLVWGRPLKELPKETRAWLLAK